MTQDVRLEQLSQWLHSLAAWEQATIAPASHDASTRRYFRATLGGKTAIVMDAPDDQVGVAAFLDIGERLARVGVSTPAVYAQNRLDGFLLLEDFGNTLLLDRLDLCAVEGLYEQAMTTLMSIQTAAPEGLPVYDAEFFRRELDIMPEWFLGRHLGFRAEDQPTELIHDTFSWLVDELLQQPQSFVHRDYHSRNLMLTEHKGLGVIDYQGAVLGPVTYDLMSLLRDCYIAWPQKRVEIWVDEFRKAAIAKGSLQPVDQYEFLRWFDLMSLQRHIKVLGIFARLNHRDGKSAYLQDLPRVLSYVLLVGERYPETAPLIAWLRAQGIPEKIGTVIIPA